MGTFRFNQTIRLKCQPASMFINTHELHIETYGAQRSDPVIFLHHGLGSTQAWRRQFHDFVEAGYRVIAYDRWGYGKSESRPSLAVPSFEDDLADLRALLETKNLQLITLIGHSDGASIALKFAAEYPEKVKALVTVAAHIYLESKMEPGIQSVRFAFKNDQRFRKGLQRAHGEKFESTFNNWYDGWHNPVALEWDMRASLSKIQCPTLVIQGDNDEHATPQHAIDIAENIHKAELWLVPGAKHMLPQEIAEGFNQRVLDFLGNIPPNRNIN
jgi:pimeloyl-ACP methyl ester carboxylesterase